MQICYYGSCSCFSEECLFKAEAISPEFEVPAVVSFVLLDTLIHTSPPSKTQWRILSKRNNNSEGLNLIENRCLHEDFIALLPVTCNSP